MTLPCAEGVTGPSFKTERGTLYTGTALMFNLRKPPFHSARARRAVASALDVRRITQNTVGFDERSFEADRGYLHPESGAASELPLQRFDPENARSGGAIGVLVVALGMFGVVVVVIAVGVVRRAR